jgi:hypothetical protein
MPRVCFGGNCSVLCLDRLWTQHLGPIAWLLGSLAPWIPWLPSKFVVEGFFLAVLSAPCLYHLDSSFLLLFSRSGTMEDSAKTREHAWLCADQVIATWILDPLKS